MSAPRRVVWLLAVVLVLGVGAAVGLTLLDYQPDVLRVVLVALVLGAVLALVLEARSEPQSWESRFHGAVMPSGQDTRTSTYLRLIEGNRTARDVQPGLRDRLALLTEQVLRARYAITSTDDRARERIGPHLLGVLEGPPRRLSAAELDACLNEIEDL